MSFSKDLSYQNLLFYFSFNLHFSLVVACLFYITFSMLIKMTNWPIFFYCMFHQVCFLGTQGFFVSTNPESFVALMWRMPIHCIWKPMRCTYVCTYYRLQTRHTVSSLGHHYPQLWNFLHTKKRVVWVGP